MNNRYLYRAKRTDNGELVEGYYAFIDNHHYIYTGNLCNGGLYVVAERFEIDITTLCACTGLKDKNGNLIWENDIVHNGNYFVVKWNLSCARFDFALNNSHNIPVGRWEPMIIDWKNSDFKEYRNNIDFEVIGNIFDNPELLE